MNKEITYSNLNYLRASCAGNTEIMKKILEMFLSTTPDLLEKMHQAARDGSNNEVKKMAHKIKSSFKTMGASSVGISLEKVETEASENSEILDKMISDVRKEADFVFEELNESLKLL